MKMLSSSGAEWSQRCRRSSCQRCALPQVLTFLKFLIVAVERAVIKAYFYHQTSTYHLQLFRARAAESAGNCV